MKKFLYIILSVIMATCFTISSVAYTKPSGSNVYIPVAAGTETFTQSGATVDSSNKDQGYIMIKYSGSNSKIKVQISNNNNTYTYDLTSSGNYNTFPLSEGNGSYSVKVFENITGTQYSMLLSKTFNVTLVNDKIPFLYKNQYVDFTNQSQAAIKATELSATVVSDAEVVNQIFNYVTDNITYDTQKAANVQSGYLPNVDETLATKKGICFDYASLMTAMLRSQNIPTKLIIGYTGSIYHAWINVYIEGQGWIENVIYYDGLKWTLIDPTFAASNQKSSEIMSYIADSSHYQAKFTY